MIWEKAREHETRLGFTVLRAKATILLHCLIKFINWIRCLLSIHSQILISSQRGYSLDCVCVGVRWWGNMKNRTVYGVFCCSVVLPYGFYSSLIVRLWWEGYMRDAYALQSSHFPGSCHRIFKSYIVSHHQNTHFFCIFNRIRHVSTILKSKRFPCSIPSSHRSHIELQLVESTHSLCHVCQFRLWHHYTSSHVMV